MQLGILLSIGIYLSAICLTTLCPPHVYFSFPQQVYEDAGTLSTQVVLWQVRHWQIHGYFMRHG